MGYGSQWKGGACLIYYCNCSSRYNMCMSIGAILWRLPLLVFCIICNQIRNLFWSIQLGHLSVDHSIPIVILILIYTGFFFLYTAIQLPVPLLLKSCRFSSSMSCITRVCKKKLKNKTHYINSVIQLMIEFLIAPWITPSIFHVV